MNAINNTNINKRNMYNGINQMIHRSTCQPNDPYSSRQVTVSPWSAKVMRKYRRENQLLQMRINIKEWTGPQW